MIKDKIYVLLLLSLAILGVAHSCTDEPAEEIPHGVQIKAFSPVAVMQNTPMIITGANLDQVTEIIFPGEISVSDFEAVGSNMIRVSVPAGVSEGTLRLKSADGTAESALVMHPAKPGITSMEPGDEAHELDVITFKGEDLDCISRIVFPAAEGDDVVVYAMSFMRKSSGHLKVRVPVGVRNGMAAIRLIALDGSELVSTEINLLAGEKTPDGSVTCNIINVSSGRYLTRNPAEDYPRIMNSTGSRDQEFVFLPADGTPGSYYLKNSATGEYLIIGDDNDWRMIWVADPTTISSPEKGMYQVMEIEGSANIQIKNVSSGMLGTDSDDENSEVYGNKWGETEPRYLWKLDIISGSFDVPGPAPTLWEGSLEYGDWNVLELEATLFANLLVGDKIRMHFIPEEGQYAQMDLRDSNDRSFPDFEWLGLGETAGYVELPVTEDAHSRITAGGLLIRGSHYTVTKVEIISEAPVVTDKVLWEGFQEFGEWFVVTIEPEYLQNLTADDVIRMHFIPAEGQYAQMDLRDSDDRSFSGFEWLGLGDFADGYVDFAMDEGIQQRLVGGGLLIRGSYYTLTKVEIL